MLEMCYASSAKEYRKQMAGAPEAGSLPAPTDEGVRKWERVATSFEQLNDEIAEALRAAEAAHTGAAADAANASIGEIKPLVDAAARTSRQVKAALVEQNGYQHEAFRSLPAEGDTLPSGQEALLDPPQKGWVENWGLDQNPITGWMSDYEDRQQAYVDTNQQANQAMERYSQQTETVVARLPEFQPVDQPSPPGPQQPVGVTPAPVSGGSSYGAAAHSGGAHSAAPAGTSSAWASGPVSPAHVGAVGPASPAPAGTSSAWAPAASLPAGVTRGADGALYRQNPQTGAWERMNPNGTWSSVGSAGARGSRDGSKNNNSNNNGGAAAPLTGRGALGEGAVPSRGAGQVGGPGSGGRGMGAGSPGGHGKHGVDEDEENNERPSWLVEEEDIWTNDMQRTAPPVFGE